MAESCDERPQCRSDDLEVTSIHDIRPSRRLTGTMAGETEPVARTVWIRCRSCGWDG
jgi:hypothetical protein